MIEESDGLFCLHTAHTSLLLRRTAYGHIELIHYGSRVTAGDADALAVKNTSAYGCAVNYSVDDPFYSLDTLPQVWSGAGRGDYRESPAELMSAVGSATDFVYLRHEIVNGISPMDGMPQGRDGDETLILTLTDASAGAELALYFTVFYDADVISRHTVLTNTGSGDILVRKLMSQMIDLPGSYIMTTFNGSWIAEARRLDARVGETRLVNESVTGMSSNRHNPGFLLSEPDAREDFGRVYGFNLVWSGNHYASAQLSHQGVTRVMQGVSPADFAKTLAPGQSLSMPEAIMSFSDEGFNGLSAHMHDFVNGHIIPAYWRERERPVLYNSWEGCGMDFTERRLLDLGRSAAKLGCELFVLDDGWFGARNSDTAGLGDYDVNRKKLPGGLDGLAKKLKGLGLQFGLWFEPEAVNPDSDLFRAHPDWAISEPDRKPVYGRNELLLDLTKSEVRDYIVEKMAGILDSADITYVKWDMNRHSTALGAKAFDYILGLYEVLDRVFGPRPEILLENCASGGNRFDLGVLCWGPQTWASDDTDPIERLDIQNGLSYLYPQSAMGAHVTASPHAQTLRATPLSTRGNVSFFGVLGYELDLKYLTPLDEKDIQDQIAYYKRHRRLFQFGRFRRLPAPSGETRWQISAGPEEAAVGIFYRLNHAAPPMDELRAAALEPEARYTIAARHQNLRVGDFGALVHYVAPVRLNPRGILMNVIDGRYAMSHCKEKLEASGRAIMSGIRLNTRYTGTGYNENIRMQTDFGSAIYRIERVAAPQLPETAETTGEKA